VTGDRSDPRRRRKDIDSDMKRLEKLITDALKIMQRYDSKMARTARRVHGYMDDLLLTENLLSMTLMKDQTVRTDNLLQEFLDNIRQYRIFRQKAIIDHADYGSMNRQSSPRDIIRHL